MIKRTFGDVKDELRRVSGSSGTRVDDPRLIELVNLAQERLSTLGEWPYQYARIKFRQFGGVVTLPTEYEALVHTTIDNEPVEIQPPWFEFLESGPGTCYQRDQWHNQGLDHGESPVYLQPGPEGAGVTVTSTSSDDTGTVTLFGFDTNGIAQTAQFVLPQATSTINWRKIARVVKPVTAGDVVLSLTSPFGEQATAATYRSVDTVPSFRTYVFPTTITDRERVIQGIARRRLFKIAQDTDELFITNIGALRLAVKGVAFEDADDIGNAEQCFEAAAKILRDESTLYHASRNTSPINVSRVQRLSIRPDIY